MPNPIPVTAMVDTGAPRSVIQDGLAAQLNLKPIGRIPISSVTAQGVLCYEYQVRFSLPNGIIVEGAVIEAPLQGQQIQALIGRDILAHSVLVYIGRTNQFTIAF